MTVHPYIKSLATNKITLHLKEENIELDSFYAICILSFQYTYNNETLLSSTLQIFANGNLKNNVIQSVYFYADESICQLDTLMIDRIYWLMSLFLHYVITFDKQKRNLQFFDHV